MKLVCTLLFLGLAMMAYAQSQTQEQPQTQQQTNEQSPPGRKRPLFKFNRLFRYKRREPRRRHRLHHDPSRFFVGS